MTDLPLVMSCNACGACCRWQGAPPDYVALRLNRHFEHDPSFAEDFERLQQLPEEAVQLLDSYLELSSQDLVDHHSPCVWLDDQLESCRFYDERPSTCRILDVGSPGCLIYRKMYGIDPVE